MTFIPFVFVLFRAQEMEGGREAGRHRCDRAECRPLIFPYLFHHLPYSALTHLGNLWLRVDALGQVNRSPATIYLGGLGGSSPIKTVHLQFQQKLAYRVASVLTRSIT